MNPYMNDRNVLMLPHPVRADAALGQSAEQLMFASTGMMGAIQPHLTQGTFTTEWIINRAPGMQEMAMLSLSAPGGFNMGTLVLMLARARLRAHGDPILQVAAPLQAQLLETDLGAQLAVRFFRCPYPRDELSAVRGGFNVGSVGGQPANQTLFGGGGINSPITAVSAPVNAPVLTQADIHPTTLVDLNTNNVLASQNTLIAGR